MKTSLNYLKKLYDKDQNERMEYRNFIIENHGGNYNKGGEAWCILKKRMPNDVFDEIAEKQKFISLENDFEYDSLTNEEWGYYFILSLHCDFDKEFQLRAMERIKNHYGDSSKEYIMFFERLYIE